ncbi:hypothetical protein SAMN05445756_0164 [Kytococcus aerolatus]|uniref:Primosomal protein n=1 Tax=Kytococcus aerolatus TaxID=592308 RepID=A0A212T209_9MICO|nr:hypothetical protein [Kytococcus aerolatus]SNC59896.1 hypothetical protein SAMN05445756_0164 [Kytococcus aerolatus]
MATDPRTALTTLVTALERHLDACATRDGEEDPRVIAAYNDLADAFEDYDEALLEAHGEVTPFEVFSDEEDDEDYDDLEDMDDDLESSGDEVAAPATGRSTRTDYDDEADEDLDEDDTDDDEE